MAAGSRCQNVGSRVGCGTEQAEITLSISLVKIGNRDADEPNAHGLPKSGAPLRKSLWEIVEIRGNPQRNPRQNSIHVATALRHGHSSTLRHGSAAR
jgi:hypothetical protein